MNNVHCYGRTGFASYVCFVAQPCLTILSDAAAINSIG
ncbi:conserved protein of unknown function [Pseudomonas marincola]|uniref:Uncharacterized protein n=1 Tax=Pseudomonas marincola TaxID=437900 RepID=A0A653E854_9PSED|nr:conserved protein of unknown function [Pseudomonas marincola]